MSKHKVEETHSGHQFGELRAVPANVEETRTVQFVISNSTRDRHRTSLDPTKWQLDNFNRNGIVGYQHNVYGDGMCAGPNPDDVIGKGRAFLEGDQLIGEVTFEPADINPQAEKIFRKVLFGSLRATSVGFAELGKGNYGTGKEARGGTEETYYFAGQELLEFSIVNIPSNPDATKRALRDQTSHALMFVKRTLGGDTSFADIEKLTVGEVLRQLDKANDQQPGRAFEQEATELEVATEDLSLDVRAAQLRLKACY